MASRAEQKAQARAERIAREQAEAAAKVRRQRMSLGIGVIVVAIVAIVVVVAISSGKSSKVVNPTAATNTTSTVEQASDQRVDQLLSGIPEETDNVLGKASAPVTIIEYGDLQCSVCDMFALPTTVYASNNEAGTGVEDEIINNLVKTGKAKFEYDSLDTASSDDEDSSKFDIQQSAVYAAGMQDKAWYYLELFYNEQGSEGTNYVTTAYLDGLAKQVPGLNYAQWQKDLGSTQLTQQVQQEVAAGTKIDQGSASTPTVLVKGPKGEQLVSEGIPAYATLVKAIAAVQ